jgi:kynurenine formamidase
MPKALYDLTHKLTPQVTVTSGLPPWRFEQVWRLPEHMANVSYYSVSSHLGTHMGAPLHYYADGAVMTPDLPLSVDPSRTDGPGHRTFLGNEVLIVENAAIMKSIEARHVKVMALPLSIEHADGAPARLAVEA